MRVAEIEKRINSLVPAEPGQQRLLSWELYYQRRNRFDQWGLGHRMPKRQVREARLIARDLLIRRVCRECWRPVHMPSEMAKWHSLVRVVSLSCAAL